jgi:hypothetical protein
MVLYRLRHGAVHTLGSVTVVVERSDKTSKADIEELDTRRDDVRRRRKVELGLLRRFHADTAVEVPVGSTDRRDILVLRVVAKEIGKHDVTEVPG